MDRVERMKELSRGGSPRNAIEVSSAAVIEGRAMRLPCLHCGGEYRVLEHTRPVAGLRRVDVACRYCSAPRTVWFRLVLNREPN